VKINIYFFSYLTHFSREREIFQTKVVEENKTHILCSVTFIVNRAVYELM